MVLAETLKVVVAKLSSEPKSRRRIAELTGLSENTVRRTLKALIEMGLVEKVVYERCRASGHKCGMERFGYKVVATASVGIDSVATVSLLK